MKYSGEFRAYPAKGIAPPLRSFTKDLLVSDELSLEAADETAQRSMEYHILQHPVDHPGERCTLENIYRFSEGKDAVLIYPKDNGR